MGLARILPITAVLVILTSTATFGHGFGIQLDQQGRELSGKDQSDLAEWDTLNQQVRDFSNKRQFDRAVAAAEKALEIAKQSAYLSEAGAVGISLSSLAIGYYNQAKYAQAEPLFQSMLDLYEKKLGPDNPTVAAILNNLGSVHEHQGHVAQAESFYKRALKIDEKVLEPNHPTIAVALRNLAGIYRITHRDGDAAKLEQRAAAIEAIKR
jgi:tetratricopeptide (TPR) repeat protein